MLPIGISISANHLKTVVTCFYYFIVTIYNR